MDIEVLSQLVGNIGFPIAAFAAMYYMCNTTLKDIKNSINDLSRLIDKHVESEDDH